jgi:hypothetical protein
MISAIIVSSSVPLPDCRKLADPIVQTFRALSSHFAHLLLASIPDIMPLSSLGAQRCGPRYQPENRRSPLISTARALPRLGLVSEAMLVGCRVCLNTEVWMKVTRTFSIYYEALVTMFD